MERVSSVFRLLWLYTVSKLVNDNVSVESDILGSEASSNRAVEDCVPPYTGELYIDDETSGKWKSVLSLNVAERSF